MISFLSCQSSISYVVPSALESDTEVQDILDTLGRSGLSSLICDDEAVNVEEGSLYVFANFNVEGRVRSDLLHHITSRMNRQCFAQWFRPIIVPILNFKNA